MVLIHVIELLTRLLRVVGPCRAGIPQSGKRDSLWRLWAYLLIRLNVTPQPGIKSLSETETVQLFDAHRRSADLGFLSPTHQIVPYMQLSPYAAKT